MNLLNGTCGFSSNVVTSCPVTGFGSICPASLTMIPRAGSFTTMYSAEQRVELGCRTAWRCRCSPVSFSASTGVSTLTVPIFDSAGNPRPVSEEEVSASNCCGVHVPSPEPADGFAVYPTGSATRVSFRFEVAMRFRVFPGLRDQQRDVQAARGFRGARRRRTSIEGSNGTRSHSAIGGISVFASDHSSGCSHESASIVAMQRFRSSSGFDRNGLRGCSLSSPPTTRSCVAVCS